MRDKETRRCEKALAHKWTSEKEKENLSPISSQTHTHMQSLSVKNCLTFQHIFSSY